MVFGELNKTIVSGRDFGPKNAGRGCPTGAKTHFELLTRVGRHKPIRYLWVIKRLRSIETPMCSPELKIQTTFGQRVNEPMML